MGGSPLAIASIAWRWRVALAVVVLGDRGTCLAAFTAQSQTRGEDTVEEVGSLKAGARSRRKVRLLVQSCPCTAASWRPLAFPQPVKKIIHNVTWRRASCQVSKSPEHEKYYSCKQAWQAAWKRKRSRSQHARKEKSKKEKERVDKHGAATSSENNPQEESAWTSVPERMPWATTTPQSRFATRELHHAAPPADDLLPPQPVLPAPEKTAFPQCRIACPHMAFQTFLTTNLRQRIAIA